MTLGAFAKHSQNGREAFRSDSAIPPGTGGAGALLLPFCAAQRKLTPIHSRRNPSDFPAPYLLTCITSIREK